MLGDLSVPDTLTINTTDSWSQQPDFNRLVDLLFKFHSQKVYNYLFFIIYLHPDRLTCTHPCSPPSTSGCRCPHDLWAYKVFRKMVWIQLRVWSEKVTLCIFSPQGLDLKARALSGAGAPRPLHVKASEQSRKQPGLLPFESPGSPEETLTSCLRARQCSLMVFVFLKRRGLPQLNFLSPSACPSAEKADRRVLAVSFHCLLCRLLTIHRVPSLSRCLRWG